MTAADGDLTAGTRREVATFLDGWQVRRDVPGASVAVVDEDGCRYAEGLGARDVEARLPATPDTRYPFASATKVVTAAAVLALVDRGDLALDTAISDHVDVWADVPGDPITVADLLSHSSGMPDDYVGHREYLFSETPPASPVLTDEDRRRHLDGMADRRVVDEERFMYSDTGYLLLGDVVEAVTGRAFEAVIADLVFDPLGMDDATVGYGELTDLDDAATGYAVEDGTPTPTPFALDGDVTAANSGLLASVREVGRFVRCLLNDGELDGTRVLSASLVEAMCSHQAPRLEHVDGTERGCGYGPRVTELLGERLVEHTGTAPGVGRAYLGLLPERGLGVALAVNTADVPVGALGAGVLAIVVGEDPEAAVPYLGLRRKVRAVAGTYESPRGETRVTVEPADGEAYVEASREGGWSLPAFPESMEPDDYWFYAVWPGGLKRTLTFHDTEGGMELRLAGHRLERTTLVA